VKPICTMSFAALGGRLVEDHSWFQGPFKKNERCAQVGSPGTSRAFFVVFLVCGPSRTFVPILIPYLNFRPKANAETLNKRGKEGVYKGGRPGLV